MIKINYESDFKLTEKTEERFADVPFTFTYTTNSGIYTASYDGGAYTRCKRNEDGSITVIFNDHGLGVGKLRVRREFFIPDEDFPDGVYNIISNDTTDVILVEGKTEGFDVENSFRPPYIEGDGDTIVSVEVVDNLDSDASDKALSANQGRILNEHINVVTTDVEEIDESIKSINETLGHTNAAINENTNNIKSNAEEIIKTKADLDALEGIVAEKADASKVSQIETDVQKNTNAISNNTARLVVLEGDGEGSIKNAVVKGIAQVVANAPDDLDTLKEVADYIASDKTKANEIEKAISDLGVKDTQLEDSINANATAILSKQPLLTGDEFKTIDGKSIMGEGNIDLPKVEIVNNLTTGGADKALSAEMGKVLKGMIPTKVSELENDEGYITEIPDNIATKEDVSEAVSGKQDALTLTVKDNGNIVIGNISGQSKEFMPATPSGDPMHYAYVSAGAEYNDTDDFILKDAPWKDMVDTIEDKAKWGLDVVDASRVKQMTIEGVVYNYATENRTSPEGGTYLRYFLVGQGSNGVWVEDETRVLHLPKCWYLNELGDLTTQEMRVIYAESQFNSYPSERVFINKTTRTMIDRSTAHPALSSRNYQYYNNKNIITIRFIYNYVSTLECAFYNCQKLKHVYTPLMVQTVSRFHGAFDNCNSLITVLLYSVRYDISFASSQFISKSSVKYMIDYATPTSAITITLHADAYARLAEDADIVAALEAKPLVTLVSA